MSRTTLRVAIRSSLLAASCLTASPLLAQDASVEERLDRLEAMVGALIERMDAQEGANSEHQAAMRAQMREQSEALLAATQDLKSEQTELAQQVAANEQDNANGFKIGNTRIEFDGYVKVDAISQRFSGGDVADGSIIRDFRSPGAIPVGGDPSGFASAQTYQSALPLVRSMRLCRNHSC